MASLAPDRGVLALSYLIQFAFLHWGQAFRLARHRQVAQERRYRELLELQLDKAFLLQLKGELCQLEDLLASEGPVLDTSHRVLFRALQAILDRFMDQLRAGSGTRQRDVA